MSDTTRSRPPAPDARKPSLAAAAAAALAAPAMSSAARERDRFLPFAFAAADLLVEVTPDGRITFAIGAFVPRFGREADGFIGRHARSLIAPEDQTAFAVALAAASVKGRIPPLLLRLGDRARSLSTVAGLLIPGTPWRLCLTLGPAPIAASAAPAAEATTGGAALAGGGFARAVAASVQGGPGPTGGTSELGLVEVSGWSAAREALSSADHRALREDIMALLLASGPAALASEVADGRFGVLTHAPLDVEAIVRAVQQVVGSGAAGRVKQLGLAPVEGVGMRLDSQDIAPAQAAGALKFALSRFAAGGIEAAREAGGAKGLAGVVAAAQDRAAAVQRSIAERRFRLQFQPVVHLARRELHHFEALLRPIATPQVPIRSTQEFVTFVEAVGLSEELDWAVLQEVLRVVGRPEGPPVAVNVSGLSMQSEAFRERTLAALAATPLSRRIMFELTETAEIEDMAAAAATMMQFRAAGVELCLDDFGAGAAAFRYLRELPVDYVKIDGAYVRSALNSPRERGFVVSMIDLARSVGARTVAEMIETEAEMRLMAELGVEFGQGWLFGPLAPCLAACNRLPRAPREDREPGEPCQPLVAQLRARRAGVVAGDTVASSRPSAAVQAIAPRSR